MDDAQSGESERLQQMLHDAGRVDQPVRRDLATMALQRLRVRGMDVTAFNEVLQSLRDALLGFVSLLAARKDRPDA